MVCYVTWSWLMAVMVTMVSVVEGSDWCGGDWLAVVEARHKPQVEVLVVVSLVSIVSCLAGSYKPGQTCAQCPGVRI